MKTETARTNMIKQQIRACDVLDDHLLQVIQGTPREDFVPEKYRELAAFADINIPLDHEQVMMTPRDEGIMLQSLAIKESDSVLEIGTGTGYITAILAKLAREVASFDIFEDFTTRTASKLAMLGIKNVSLNTGDALSVLREWKNAKPYDVIVITGSLPFLPKYFQQILDNAGRLFAVLGHSPAMQASLVTRLGENTWQKEVLFETVLKPLINAPSLTAFQF